jgi:hypothetical protein
MSLSKDKASVRRAKVLGMPFGTAQARLRKSILFNLLKKHSENICCRCLNSIDDIKELSIEHIKPWEDRDVKLFWDLDNIAFSHLKCNVPHTSNQKRKEDEQNDPNKSWCWDCKEFKDLDSFHNGERHNGKTARCITCYNAWRKIYRRNKKSGAIGE